MFKKCKTSEIKYRGATKREQIKLKPQNIPEFSVGLIEHEMSAITTADLHLKWGGTYWQQLLVSTLSILIAIITTEPLW